MEHSRDEATEAMLGEIITQGSDVVASFLNDTDGQEGDPMEVQEEGYVHDGSGDPMEVQEGDRDDITSLCNYVPQHRFCFFVSGVLHSFCKY